MTKRVIAIFCLIFFGSVSPAAERKLEPLPVAVSWNAVSAQKVEKRLYLFSFMGIGEKKTWNAVTNRAFALDTENGKWNEYRPVPGPAGRLAASAIAMREVVYLLGGYTLDAIGDETSVRSMEVLLPSRGIWYRGEEMPIPLDSTVIGVYRDRFLYTVAGRSQGNPVSTVQVYDAEKNTWRQATTIPGTPVFGHAGAMMDDTIVYVDGARLNPAGDKPRYIPSDECWMGKIDHHDVSKIQWSKIPTHPGSARFQIAATGSEKDHKIYFAGGASKPFNHSGIAYEGGPVEPSAMLFAWNLKMGKWEIIMENTADPVMANGGLLITREGFVRIGGMEAGQRVTSKVTVIPRK